MLTPMLTERETGKPVEWNQVSLKRAWLTGWNPDQDQITARHFVADPLCFCFNRGIVTLFMAHYVPL